MIKCDICTDKAKYSYKDKSYCQDCMIEIVESEYHFDVEVYVEKSYVLNGQVYSDTQIEGLLEDVDCIEKI